MRLTKRTDRVDVVAVVVDDVAAHCELSADSPDNGGDYAVVVAAVNNNYYYSDADDTQWKRWQEVKQSDAGRRHDHEKVVVMMDTWEHHERVAVAFRQHNTVASGTDTAACRPPVVDAVVAFDFALAGEHTLGRGRVKTIRGLPCALQEELSAAQLGEAVKVSLAP